ncbi:hypothetical protein EJB05_53084, partial [Eragrostis curvula]
MLHIFVRNMVNEGVTNGDASAAYVATTYQPAASAAPSDGASLPTVTQDAPVCPVIQPQLADEHQIASKEAQRPHHDHKKQELQAFWSGQLAEIQQTTRFKNHNLPLARIKKIMKADSDVHRISGEAPMVFAKACEMFIQELTLRGWHHAQENKRRTIQKNDITEPIARTEVFDFMVPSDEKKGTSVLPTPTAVQEDDDDPYANYYECDCFSCPSSPDEPDLRNSSSEEQPSSAAHRPLLATIQHRWKD